MARGIGEKQVPRYLSYAAIIAGILLGCYLWTAGIAEPRRFVGDMAISHHGGYGDSVECYKCHVPVGGVFSIRTEMNCYTAKCHGELTPMNPREERVKKAQAIYAVYPDAAERGRRLLDIHDSLNSDCWECHREHGPDPAKNMGMKKAQAMLREGQWVSVLGG